MGMGGYHSQTPMQHTTGLCVWTPSDGGALCCGQVMAAHMFAWAHTRLHACLQDLAGAASSSSGRSVNMTTLNGGQLQAALVHQQEDEEDEDSPTHAFLELVRPQ